MIKMCRFYGLFLVLLLVMSSVSMAAESQPLSQLRTTIDSVITAISNTDVDAATTRKKIEGLIGERFDFRAMSQGVLATRWKKTGAADRKAFIVRFSRLLKATYMNRLEDYSGERVTYVGEKVDGKRAVIDTVIASSGADIPITYKMRKRGDNWLIYDVVIENISLLRNYRSSYREIIRKKGITGLLAQMDEKIDSLRSARDSGSKR